MKRIKSFEVDHTKVSVGMYISRIDGDVVTYDLRCVKPNGGVYMSPASMHTTEHILATYVRNSKFGENIIYAGPMGCRTGFYLLTRGISNEEAITLVREALDFISKFEGAIPGVSEAECGNYLEHDLQGAKENLKELMEKLDSYTPEMLEYDWHFSTKS